MKSGVFVAAVLVLGACSAPVVTKPTVTIPLGAALDRTGSSSTQSWQTAITLALKHANDGLAASNDPVLGNVRFSMTYSDTENLVAVATTRATELVRGGAKGLLLQQAPVAIAVNGLNYTADAGAHLNVPMVCGNCVLAQINNPAATDPNPDLQAGARDPDNWLFRSAPPNDKDAAILVRILMANANGDANNDGKFKIAVYAASLTAQNSFRSAVENQAKAARADAIVEKSVQFPVDVNVDTYNFSADIEKLVDNQNEDMGGVVDAYPDAIIELSATGVSAAFTRAYKTRNETVRVLHSANFRNLTSLVTLGDLANGQEGTSPVVVETSSSGAAFAESLLAESGSAPALQDSSFYDGAMMMMLGALVAIQANASTDPASVTPTQLRDGMMQLSDASAQSVGSGTAEFTKAVQAIAKGTKVNYDGASGPMDFDSVGDVKGRVVRWKVINREFVDEQRYDCVADPSCP